MNRLLLAGIMVTGLLAIPLLAAENSETEDAVTFKSRMKREQTAAHTLKIYADQISVPLNSEMLTTLMNSPAVAGAAAKEALGLDARDYTAYLKIKARVSQGPVWAFANLEVNLRADQFVPPARLERLADALARQLASTLNSSLDDDRLALAAKHAQIMEKRAALQSELAGLRSRRMELAVSSGLAEVPDQFYRANVGKLLTQEQDLSLSLGTKKARCDALTDLLAGSPGSADPAAADPVAVELQKLVQGRDKVVKSLTASGAKLPEIAMAESMATEAAVRWAQRREDIKSASPAAKVQQLAFDAAELKSSLELTAKFTTTARQQAREQFQADAAIAIINIDEGSLVRRIETLEQQLDQVDLQLAGLHTIRVIKLGQTEKGGT